MNEFSGDELAGRRRRGQIAGHPSAQPATDDISLVDAEQAAAAADRELAALDRQRAADYLAAAYHDELTGVLARRAGQQQLRAELDKAHASSMPLALIFVDVDGLKHINDVRGHLAGDALLAATGAALAASLRSYDVVVRYGGDEFVCALPGGTTAGAAATVDRARHELATVMAGAALSAGIAELRPGESLDELVQRADADLHRRRALARDVEHPDPGTSVACGVCAARISLVDFVVTSDALMTRAAECPGCGEMTLIRLARVPL
jgi:diguanylate cyclase (GGDEF)-like protein